MISQPMIRLHMEDLINSLDDLTAVRILTWESSPAERWRSGKRIDAGNTAGNPTLSSPLNQTT
jgi:hypothetical protein